MNHLPSFPLSLPWLSMVQQPDTATPRQGKGRDEQKHLTFSPHQSGSAGLPHPRASGEISIPWFSDPFQICEDCISVSHICGMLFAVWHSRGWRKGYLYHHWKVSFPQINLVPGNVIMKNWDLFFFFLTNSHCEKWSINISLRTLYSRLYIYYLQIKLFCRNGIISGNFASMNKYGQICL